MIAYWREAGPPVNIATIAIARAHGFNWDSPQEAEGFYGEIEPTDGPSIEELTAQISAAPRAGGDTAAASAEVMRLLLAPEGSS